jgi:hypothetical protein
VAKAFIADARAALELVPTAVETYPSGAVLILWDGVRKACAAHAIAHGIRFTQEASHGKALTYAESALDGLVQAVATRAQRTQRERLRQSQHVDGPWWTWTRSE